METHASAADAVRRAREAQARAMETLLRVREDNARRSAQRESRSLAGVAKARQRTKKYNRLVQTPDARGSICFLVAGYLAYLEVCGRPACRPRRALEWWIAAFNLLGCVAFGISAIASQVVPSTGSALDLAKANSFTAFGALCFLIGAALLLPESAD